MAELKIPSQDETEENVQEQFVKTKSAATDADRAAEELRRSMTPMYLGDDTAVVELVEWATRKAELVSAHRKGERAWHCMGQRVLSIKTASGKPAFPVFDADEKVRGFDIRAGIHAAGAAEAGPRFVKAGGSLSSRELAAVKRKVRAGIGERLGATSQKYHKPDEHWLQAVIRDDPGLVGVEQPALREVPAWRPTADTKHWGRGFIDLLGLDGVGNIRIVETKLEENSDALLVFQGLDYYIWAKAMKNALRERLGASRGARLTVHYVVGGSESPAVHLSQFVKAQIDALEIPFRFQTIINWFGNDAAPIARMLPPGELP